MGEEEYEERGRGEKEDEGREGERKRDEEKEGGLYIGHHPF